MPTRRQPQGSHFSSIVPSSIPRQIFSRFSVLASSDKTFHPISTSAVVGGAPCFLGCENRYFSNLSNIFFVA